MIQLIVTQEECIIAVEAARAEPFAVWFEPTCFDLDGEQIEDHNSNKTRQDKETG